MFISKTIENLSENLTTLFFGAGCFWGGEQYFSLLPGVIYTDVGYANSTVANPSYEAVCNGHTHAVETVRVIFDIDKLSLQQLLTAFFSIINPTTKNRQGPDIGTQYRSGVYVLETTMIQEITAFIATQKHRYSQPIVVEVLALENYYRAEEYHQKYLQKNPHGYCHISADCFREVSKNGAPVVSTSALDAHRYHRPTDEHIRHKLSSLAWRVTQDSATEAPFTDPFHAGNPEKGLYVDVVTGEPLFLTVDQFNSGCGWPSFSRPIDPSVITEHQDVTLGMWRTEIRSRVGDSHLGHVFNDGPELFGGLRYCINGAALRFIPISEMAAEGYQDLIDRLT